MQTTEAEPAGSRAVTKGARVKGSEGEGRRKRRTRLSSGKKLGGASAERCREVEQTSSTTCSYMGGKTRGDTTDSIAALNYAGLRVA